MSSRTKAPKPSHSSKRPAPARAAKAAPWSLGITLNGPAEIAPAEALLWRRLAWVLAAVLGAALLAMVVGPHRIGDYFTETDFYGGYAEGARRLMQGHLDPSRYGVIGPVYEMTLAALGFVVRDLFVAAELLSVASTLATLLLLFDLLARRTGERVALLAALFYATNTFVFRSGYSATTDSFSIALQVLAMWLLLTRESTRGTTAAGVAAAAAFLTRYNAVYLLPAGLLIVWKARGRALSFAAGFVLPVALWVTWCLANGSHFSFQLHHNIAYEVYARHQGIVWDDYQKKLQPQFHNLWDVIRRDPPEVVKRMFLNLFDHLRLDGRSLLGWPVAIAAVLGAALAIASGAFAPVAPLAIAAALLFLSLVPTFYAERYSMALLPFYATLAALLFGLPKWALVWKDRGPWIKTLLVVVPIAFTLQTSVKLEQRALQLLPVEVLDASKALRALARPGDSVIARKPHLAWLSGVTSVAFPFTDDIPALAKYAHDGHVRWLFVSWPEVETRPRYWHLLDTTGVMPGLTPRHVTSPHPSVIYEIGPEFGKLPAWYTNDTLMTYHSARATLMVTPNDYNAHFQLATTLAVSGQLDSARVEFERSLRGTIDDVPALNQLGQLALERSDWREASIRFDAALQFRPRNAEAIIGLGWATLLDGRIEQAGRIWEPVIERTADQVTLERMASVYHRLGDTRNETECLTRLAEARSRTSRP